MKFKELGLDDGILEAISYMGFEEATEIQEKAIPLIMEGNDIIGCAQTGTGKTAAFLLPIMHKVIRNKSKNTSTLIIVPTRELALQIDQQFQGFGYFAPVTSIPVYGGGSGADWEQQKKALKQQTDIIIATPGKLISHLNMGFINLKDLKYLILDEADRMLDMGFREDIQKVIDKLPKGRQTLMFSATMAPKIRSFAKKILNDPKEVNVAIGKPAAGVLQAAYLVNDDHKTKLLDKLIKDKPAYKSIIIFSSTKKKVADIHRSLKRQGHNVESISSDLTQETREQVLSNFRSKRTRILVGTDVISRGIDIADINLVINFDVPGEAADYVHRVGRTARADTTGVAITLINQDDMHDFSKIEELIDTVIHKLEIPPEMGESPKWDPKYRPKQRGGGRGRHGGGGGRGRGGNSRGKSGGGNRNRGGASGKNRSGGNNKNRGPRGNSSGKSKSDGGGPKKG